MAAGDTHHLNAAVMASIPVADPSSTIMQSGAIARTDTALHGERQATTPRLVPASPCASEDSAPAAVPAGEFGCVLCEYSVNPRVLGAGLHGSVRECVRRTTGERYAVKSVPKKIPAARACVAREIALLREMDHPNVVRIVNADEDVEYVHVVTELCAGGELFDRIVANCSRDNGAACFEEDDAARVLRQVLAAVSHMHKHSIVHRDIKPENILFETSGKDSPVKVVDFGLAREHFEGVDPPMRAMVGTPLYVAPEVLQRRYGRSCDLWSVGVVTYAVLCGYPPFQGDTQSQVYDCILRGQCTFPSEDWSGVGEEAVNFVRGLLTRDPGARMSAEGALDHPWVQCRAGEARRRAAGACGAAGLVGGLCLLAVSVRSGGRS